MSPIRAWELRIAGISRKLLEGVADPGADGQRIKVDLLTLPYFVDERPLRGLAALIDWREGGVFSRVLRSGWSSGTEDEGTLMLGGRYSPAVRLLLWGLGARRDWEATGAQAAGVRLARRILALDPGDMAVALPVVPEGRDGVEALFMGLVAGLGPELCHPGAQDDAVEGEAVDIPSVDAPWIVGASLDKVPTQGPDCGRWWVLADAHYVGRLRRLLEGPPRCAQS